MSSVADHSDHVGNHGPGTSDQAPAIHERRWAHADAIRLRRSVANDEISQLALGVRWSGRPRPTAASSPWELSAMIGPSGIFSTACSMMRSDWRNSPCDEIRSSSPFLPTNIEVEILVVGVRHRLAISHFTPLARSTGPVTPSAMAPWRNHAHVFSCAPPRCDSWSAVLRMSIFGRTNLTKFFTSCSEAFVVSYLQDRRCGRRAWSGARRNTFRKS